MKNFSRPRLGTLNIWLKCSSSKVILGLGKPRYLCFLCINIFPGTRALTRSPGLLHKSQLGWSRMVCEYLEILEECPQCLCRSRAAFLQGEMSLLCSLYSPWMRYADQTCWLHLESRWEFITDLTVSSLWLQRSKAWTSGFHASAKWHVGTSLFKEQKDLVKIPRTPYHKLEFLSTALTAHCWPQICRNIRDWEAKSWWPLSWLRVKQSPYVSWACTFLTDVKETWNPNGIEPTSIWKLYSVPEVIFLNALDFVD